MARSRPSPPGPPPTLAYFAKQAVGIDAECYDCRRRVVLEFEQFLDRYGDGPFPDFARLMKCSACGSRNPPGVNFGSARLGRSLAMAGRASLSPAATAAILHMRDYG